MINAELRGASGSIERMNDDDDDGDDERVRESVHERRERRKDRMTGKDKECGILKAKEQIEKESSVWPTTTDGQKRTEHTCIRISCKL